MQQRCILLFGPPRIELDGTPVDISRRKALALLAYVAATGQPHSRDSLATLYWPEVAQTRARGNLRRVLSDLQQELGPDWLTVDSETVAADDGLWLDVARFRACLDACETHDHGPEAVCAKCLPLLSEAIDLYQADFMAGFSLRDCPDFDDWCSFEAESLRRDYGTALDRLVVQLSKQGEHASAIEHARRRVALDRLNEAAQRQLMHLYAATGRRHDALRQYQRCTEALEAELGAAPAPETEALYQEIVGGNVGRLPAPKPSWILPARIAVEMDQGAPLVGHAGKVDDLRARVHAAWHGQGGIIFLAAEAGLGKTRMAYEVLRSAAEAGMITMVGAAYEQERHLAYHPFIEAFDRYLVEHHLAPDRNPITHYKPLGVTDLQKENSALFRATAAFLTGLTKDGPVVLLVDDLHAADEASLSMFHYLARQTRSAPIVLLATYRTDLPMQAQSPFGSLLNSLYRERLGDVVTLEPLLLDDTTLLVQHTLGGEADAELAAAIHTLAEGNPFFVQEIARTMLNAERLIQTDGVWRLAPDGTLHVPAGLQELLAERVRRLGETVESVLTGAAVIGREFRFSVLRRVTGLSDDDLLDALDAALDGRLIGESETGYRFQHSLIRLTLYDGLSRRRRARLHGRTGEAIEAAFAGQPGGLEPYCEALAQHFELSDERVRALPYMRQAADKAVALFAIEVASWYLMRALALMDELDVADPVQRWEILEKAGNLAKVLADTKHAVACYQAALDLYFPPDDSPQAPTWRPDAGDRIRVHRSLARTLIAAGRMGEAEAQLQTALGLVDEAGHISVDQANLLYDVALWHWHTDSYQMAFDTAQRSLAIAEEVNHDVARAQAYEMLALACHSLGEWQQGLGFEQQRSHLIGPRLDVTEAFDAHL